jgi:hypothetical protein
MESVSGCRPSHSSRRDARCTSPASQAPAQPTHPAPLSRQPSTLPETEARVCWATYLCEEGVLARLTAPLEARLELALARRNDQHADIGLGKVGGKEG